MSSIIGFFRDNLAFRSASEENELRPGDFMGEVTIVHSLADPLKVENKALTGATHQEKSGIFAHLHSGSSRPQESASASSIASVSYDFMQGSFIQEQD